MDKGGTLEGRGEREYLGKKVCIKKLGDKEFKEFIDKEFWGARRGGQGVHRQGVS